MHILFRPNTQPFQSKIQRLENRMKTLALTGIAIVAFITGCCGNSSQQTQ
jgi:hypothetical protein